LKMLTVNKTRLDILMVNKGLVQSRQRAKALIMAGKVRVNDLTVDKPGTLISEDKNIIVKTDDNPYVSRGGLKLEKALQSAAIPVKGLICLDIGASTGGFTDCLLQHGAAKVYAVDVGYGQLDWKLRQDKRVIVIERTNIRYMPFETINEKVDIVVADTSFISLKIVIPASEKFMKENTLILALIKPQFEAGKQNVGKGGVVRDPKIRKQVIQDIELFFTERGYLVNFVVPSPIAGPKGNVEYMIALSYHGSTKIN
jgi:23S rRNA (cytidine1920-2'-O)/16S rRNA (cytidine1409-2'-O)-methyltransferase